MGIAYQFIGGAFASYLCTTTGLMFAWPSSTLRLFNSTESPLHRTMTETELALFGSLSSVGALVSTPLAGLGMDMLGRKYSALLGSLMQVVTWCIIVLCNRVEMILLAIFLSGIGASVFLIVPVFVGEICQESIRGAMTASSMIFYGVGLLLSYLLGGCLSYYTMVYVSLSMAVTGVISLSILKESPTYLMKKGLENEAKLSIAFYRHEKTDSKEVLEQIDSIKRALNPDLDDDTKPEEQKLNCEETPDVKKKVTLWQFIKKSRSSRQALVVTLILVTSSIFQGLVVVQVYADPLFSEAVPNVSPTVCCVIFAVVVVVTGFVAAYLTDVLGRKPLMVYPSVGAGLCAVALGTQLHLHWGPHWLTAVIIYLYCIAYTFGAGTVPYVLLAEVFLPEVKSLMSMLLIEWAWLCNFIILFIFNPLVAAVGLGPVFYLFAIVCFASAVYAAVYQPETKGLPVDAIQALFLKR